MPPSRWFSRPACANPYAMAIDPNAVTIQDSSEIAPTCAMFAGSMMMPEPIMLTATTNVSCIKFIFFDSCMALPPVPSVVLFSDYVSVELDAAVDPFLVYALHFIIETGKAVERLLKSKKIVQHGLCFRVPPLARDNYADPGWIDQGKRRGNAPPDFIKRNVIHVVRDQRRVSVFRRHCKLGKRRRAETLALQLLDVRLAIEIVHFVAHTAQRITVIAFPMCRIERRQHFGKRSVAIPQVLEFDELRHQRVHLAFVFRRGHQEQDTVQITFFRNYPLLTQVIGDHRGGDTPAQIVAGLAVDAWSEQCKL